MIPISNRLTGSNEALGKYLIIPTINKGGGGAIFSRKEQNKSFIWPSSPTHDLYNSLPKWQYFGPNEIKKMSGQMAICDLSTKCLYLLLLLATIQTMSTSHKQTRRPANRFFSLSAAKCLRSPICMVICTCCDVRMGVQAGDYEFCPDISTYPAASTHT